MKNNDAKITLLSVMLIFSLLLAGCTFTFISGNQSQKFTKIVHMPILTLAQGSSFEAKSFNGSIDVFGSDVTDCNVIATITGYASSVESAEEAVEQTKLNLEPTGSGLVMKIKRPEHLMGRSVSVSLDVVLPNKVDLNLESYNGSIKIENITGKTKATSYNGRVAVRNISGETKLVSHNGSVKAENISGNIDFLSYNGKVEAVFSQDAGPDSSITMVTHNGGIDLTTPPNYSAHAQISTHNGSINTELPMTISGNLSKNKLSGMIGDGRGMLKLETNNGSIKIR